MFNNDYERGLRDGARGAWESRQSEEKMKRKREELAQWKIEIGALDWNTVGSERLRRIKASKYEDLYPRQKPMRQLRVVIILIILFYLIFEWWF